MLYRRSTTISLGRVSDQLVDQGGSGGLGDLRKFLDAEVAFEIVERRIALDALSGQQPKQVAPLRLGHEADDTIALGRLGTRRNGVQTGLPVAGRPRNARGGGSTQSGVRGTGRKAVAVQFLERDDTDIDGVPEGAGL